MADGYEKMKGSLSVADVTSTDSYSSYSQDEAYLATAKYCDTFLRLKEDGMIHYVIKYKYKFTT